MSVYDCTVTTQPGPAPDDAKAKTHHVKDKSGNTAGFVNALPSFGRWKDISLLRAGCIFFRYRLQGKLPVPDTSHAKIPTAPPSFLPQRAGHPSLRTTWIGHATVFVEFPSGFRALFDPVFEEKFGLMSPKRVALSACKPADLPALDAIFLSHNHPDHFSDASLKELIARFPRVYFFVGLETGRWLRELGVSAATEMEWWDDAYVLCLPSQHGTMRTPLDKDTALWASWGIKSGGKSVWFAGDTGYCTVLEGTDELGLGFDALPKNHHFKQIGEFRGPFDLGLIPIGAYHPRFMYSPVHASPLDAVEIF
ncbi:beta-lactamase superfamily domain-containing protein [Lophiotrema nucula]|uniref:Beta-lactamase superfamily domain-containing protein n=1 Tax=Lophiotrema nucula TaxID=690887 RepID=A0A6A5YD85_9PLEO|nr:beta-lactamase superfamily domain-containing protein [Lophiotrema nucula]